MSNFHIVREHGFSGLGRPLLPYESTFSKLIFIASKNSLNAKELCSFASFKKTPSVTQGFLNLSSWCDRNKIYRKFGLDLPSNMEVSILAKMRQYCPTLLSDRLRICPICFQDGYHSYLFQYLDIKTCPIHNCQIDNVCQSCGNLLPWYGLYSQLFDSPYVCVFCRRMLSGAPGLVDSENVFASHLVEIGFRFEKFESVFSRLSSLDHEMYTITDTRPNQSLWCRQRLLQMEVSRNLVAPVESSNCGSTGPIQILRWRIHMANKEAELKNHEYSSLLKQFNSVWRVLQRRLERWIFGKSCDDQIDILKASISTIDEFVFFADSNILQLAYGLFRIQFGNDVYFRPSHSSISPGLRRVPEIGFTELWEGRLPRAALLYGMLGSFSGLYLMLLNRSHHSKYLDLRRLTVVDADFVAMSYAISPNGLCGGVVAFPKIHGLPIRSGGKK